MRVFCLARFVALFARFACQPGLRHRQLPDAGRVRSAGSGLVGGRRVAVRWLGGRLSFPSAVLSIAFRRRLSCSSESCSSRVRVLASWSVRCSWVWDASGTGCCGSLISSPRRTTAIIWESLAGGGSVPWGFLSLVGLGSLQKDAVQGVVCARGRIRLCFACSVCVFR